MIAEARTVSAHDGAEEDHGLGDVLVAGVHEVARAQGVTGEISAMCSRAGGGLVPCRTPFVSALVHDALAVFDPSAPDWLDGSADSLSRSAQTSFHRQVVAIRAAIRRFLKWQQEPSAQWRLYGRGSGVAPDAATTSWAALAVMEDHDTRSSGRLIDAVASFREPAGSFTTFVGRDADGECLADAVAVNAEALRFLLVNGMTSEAEPVRAALASGLADPDLLVATSRFRPHRLFFTYPLSRIEASLGAAAIDDGVVGSFRVSLTRVPRPETPLSRVLLASARLALDRRSAGLDDAARDVLRDLRRGPLGPQEAVIDRIGSDALTVALQLAFLGRRTVAG
jgi:hypothetical protein